jgi:catechol 2,3-dioxygenase-like lactoylglutathione lyase family enzyme
MIGYAMIGTNDLPKALGFYDDVLTVLGARRMMAGDKFQTYGTSFPSLGVTLPYNGEPATVGNGTMVALSADSHAQVDATHARAIAAGGTCEGPPGIRGGEGSNFYAAYFRDLDGNKLCVFNAS